MGVRFPEIRAPYGMAEMGAVWTERKGPGAEWWVWESGVVRKSAAPSEIPSNLHRRLQSKAA